MPAAMFAILGVMTNHIIGYRKLNMRNAHCILRDDIPNGRRSAVVKGVEHISTNL